MAFGTVTIGSNVFNSIGAGVYSLSTVQFGSPGNIVKVSGGKVSKPSNAGYSTTYAGVTRRLEKDVTVGDTITRRACAVSLNLTVPEGFTAAEVDTLVADLSTWLDSAIITRLLLGES